jgi:hypothetical protein
LAQHQRNRGDVLHAVIVEIPAHGEQETIGQVEQPADRVVRHGRRDPAEGQDVIRRGTAQPSRAQPPVPIPELW